MYTQGFPNCCTARIITNFEGSEKDIDEYLQRTELASRGGFGILTAITTDKQVYAIAVLKKRGWKSSRWAKKKAHPDTRIKLWYKLLNN